MTAVKEAVLFPRVHGWRKGFKGLKNGQGSAQRVKIDETGDQ